MLKSVLRICLNVLTITILFILQLYVFNNLYIFGVRFDSIAVYCIIFGLFHTFKVSLPVAFVIGFITDMILGGGRLKYILIYMVAILVIEIFKSIYRLENSKSIIIYTAISFTTIQLLTVVFNYIDKGVAINIFTYLFYVIKLILINAPLAYIMFILSSKINQKLER